MKYQRCILPQLRIENEDTDSRREQRRKGLGTVSCFRYLCFRDKKMVKFNREVVVKKYKKIDVEFKEEKGVSIRLVHYQEC